MAYPPLPDLTFSNGAPLTAEDVAFTYNSAAQGGGKIDMGNFVSAKVLAYRGCHHPERPQSTFVNVLGSLGIVSKRDYDPKRYARHPVGAGPYRLVSFLPGQQLVVEANPITPAAAMTSNGWCLSLSMKRAPMPPPRAASSTWCA